MSDCELGRIGTLGVVSVLVALLLLASCAHPRTPRDSPAWRGCKASCEHDGRPAHLLLEDDDSLVRVCKKPPAPGGT